MRWCHCCSRCHGVTCDVDAVWALTPHLPHIVAPCTCLPLVAVTLPSYGKPWGTIKTFNGCLLLFQKAVRITLNALYLCMTGFRFPGLGSSPDSPVSGWWQLVSVPGDLRPQNSAPPHTSNDTSSMTTSLSGDSHLQRKHQHVMVVKINWPSQSLEINPVEKLQSEFKITSKSTNLKRFVNVHEEVNLSTYSISLLNIIWWGLVLLFSVMCHNL